MIMIMVIYILGVGPKIEPSHAQILSLAPPSEKLTSRHCKQVNFLDVTFNPSTATYHPFKKENDKLLYINTSSNHPPTVIDQIPKSIGKRLSDNSSNERIFEDTKPEYQNALKTVDTHQTSHTQTINQTIAYKQEREKDKLFGSTPHSTKAYKQT